jgi:hypothetical protein
VYSLAIHPSAEIAPTTAFNFEFVTQKSLSGTEFIADSFQIMLDTGLLAGGAGPVAAAAAAADGGDDEVVDAKADGGTLDGTLFVNSKYRTSSSSLMNAWLTLSARWIGVDAESDLAQVRGGGLLQFALYLAKGWVVAPHLNCSTMHAFMVSRFLLDFPPYFINQRYGIPARCSQVGAGLRLIEECHCDRTAVAAVGSRACVAGRAYRIRSHLSRGCPFPYHRCHDSQHWNPPQVAQQALIDFCQRHIPPYDHALQVAVFGAIGTVVQTAGLP